MSAEFCHPNIVSSTTFALFNLGIKLRTVLRSEWAGLFGNHIVFYDSCTKSGKMSVNLLYLHFLLGQNIRTSVKFVIFFSSNTSHSPSSKVILYNSSTGSPCILKSPKTRNTSFTETSISCSLQKKNNSTRFQTFPPQTIKMNKSFLAFDFEMLVLNVSF